MQMFTSQNYYKLYLQTEDMTALKNQQNCDNLSVKELTYSIIPLRFHGSTFLLMKKGLNTVLIGVSW